MSAPRPDTFPGLSKVEEWARRGTGHVDPDTLADLRGAVAEAAITGDREKLTTLRDRLSPVAAALSRRLESERLDPWITQAVSVASLAPLVRGALLALDRDRPGEVLARIPHGEAVLTALARIAREDPAGPADYRPLSLDALCAALGTDAAGDGPTRSRVSRTLTALELGGFIHLIGATRARRWALLPAAEQVLDALTMSRKAQPIERESITPPTADPAPLAPAATAPREAGLLDDIVHSTMVSALSRAPAPASRSERPSRAVEMQSADDFLSEILAAA